MWCILNPSSAFSGLSHVVFSRRAVESHWQPQTSEHTDIFNSQPTFWGEEDEFCSVSRKGRSKGATGSVRWQNSCWGSGMGWWIWVFKHPSCHFRESSLPLPYHLRLINGQSNNKGIRFWCSLTFGAVFSGQPKATCPCTFMIPHFCVASIPCSIWPHLPHGTPKQDKKPSKACFPHVCLEVKLIFGFCGVQVSVCFGISLRKSIRAAHLLASCLQKTGGNWRIFAAPMGPGWNSREWHTDTAWASLPTEGLKRGGKKGRKKPEKAFLKLILLLFLPSVACWRLLKSCCWAEQSQKLEAPICPQPCAAKIQESWFSLLLTFQPLYPPGFPRFTPLLFANVMNLKSALVLSVHSAVQLGCGSCWWGGWKPN